jgi:hypothetical protein
MTTDETYFLIVKSRIRRKFNNEYIKMLIDARIEAIYGDIPLDERKDMYNQIKSERMAFEAGIMNVLNNL